MDRIRIEGLEVRCVVGLYPKERNVTQRLIVDAELALDLSAAGKRERLSATIDYAHMSHQLAFLLERSRFRMLETAAHALAAYLLLPPARDERRAQIESVRIRLIKPEALRNRATPSVTLEREKGFVTYGREEKPFGTVDVVMETQDAGIYRLNIAPGKSIPLHVHQVMDESELVLTNGLFCQGEPAPAGTVRRWPKDAAHLYENPTDKWQSILCVDCPPFIAEDERPVEGAPATVPAEPKWLP